VNKSLTISKEEVQMRLQSLLMLKLKTSGGL